MPKQPNTLVKKPLFTTRLAVDMTKDYHTEDQRGFKVNFTKIKPLATQAYDMITHFTYRVPSIDIYDVEKFFTILQKTNINSLNFLADHIHVHSSCKWYHFTHWHWPAWKNFAQQNFDAFKKLADNEKITTVGFIKKLQYLCQEVPLNGWDSREWDALEKDLVSQMKGLLRFKLLPEIDEHTLKREEASKRFSSIQDCSDLVTYFIKKIAPQHGQQQQNFLQHGDEIVTPQDLINFSERKQHVSGDKLVKKIHQQNPEISEHGIQNIITWLADRNMLAPNNTNSEASSGQSIAPDTSDFIKLLALDSGVEATPSPS